jgi:hypothetical protein
MSNFLGQSHKQFYQLGVWITLLCKLGISCYMYLGVYNYWGYLHQIFILHTSNKNTSHIYPGFSFDLLFKVTEVKLWNFYDLLQHLAIGQIFIKFLASIHLIRISDITQVFDFAYFSRSQRSNFQMFTICSNTLTIGRIFTKFLSWIHLIRIHHILPQFWFDLRFNVAEVKLWIFYDLLPTPQLLGRSSPNIYSW